MNKETLTFSATDQLKQAFKEKRDQLKDQGKITCTQFTEFVASSIPEYNTPAGFDRIRNAYYGIVADFTLMRSLEKYESILNTNQNG